MRYKVEKTDIIDPKTDSPEWEKASWEEVKVQRWKEFYQPINTWFKMLRGPHGISVLMHTDEKNLCYKCTEENGDIYLDSCMEFFLKPDPWDLNYLNFEFNPKGVLHLGIGDGRNARTLIEENRETFSIETLPEDGNWTLKFYIPDSFLLKYFEKIAPVCKANFYKCGEGTDHSHFMAWSEVEVSSPDFHIPDFFGWLEF